MSGKSDNEIHEAYMKGLFEGKKEIIYLIAGLADDALEEIRKIKEAQE